MRSKTTHALLVCTLLLLASCGSSSKGNQAPPLVFPTTAPTPTGPLPLSIYLSSNNSQGEGENFVSALDALTGALRWRYTAKAQVDNPVALYQQSVFVGAADHKLYALSAGNGSVLWSYDMGGGVPAVADVEQGVVYAYIVQNGAGQSLPYSIFALNTSNGALKWRSSVNGIAVVVDGVMYVQASDMTLYTLNISDGSVKWHFQKQATIDFEQESVVYAQFNTSLYALNASDGSLRWQFQAAYPPLLEQVSDAIVYVFAMPQGPNSSGPNSIVSALNANTGAVQWRYPGGNDQESVQWIGAANGVAYLFTTMNQDFAHPKLALALKASTGAVRWRYQLNSQSSIIAEAALESGVIYLEVRDGTLYALSASDGSTQWQTQVGNITPLINFIDNGVIFVSLSTEGIKAVRASDGSVLWRYQPATQLDMLQASNGLLYLSSFPFSGPAASNDIDVLKISDGTIFWRYNAGATPFFAVIG